MVADILELVVLDLEEHIPAMAEEMVEHLLSGSILIGAVLEAVLVDIPEQVEMQVLAPPEVQFLLVVVEPAVAVAVAK